MLSKICYKLTGMARNFISVSPNMRCWYPMQLTSKLSKSRENTNL